MMHSAIALLSCSVPSIVYRRDVVIENPPVNLANVSHITKGQYSWYPDETGLCTIEFHMLGKDTPLVRWCFPQIQIQMRCDSNGKPRKSEEPIRQGDKIRWMPDAKQRDAEFEKIITMFSITSLQGD